MPAMKRTESNVVALKKKAAKEKKQQRRSERRKALLRRFFRSIFSFFSLSMNLFTFVASISLIMGFQWVHGNATSAGWNSISPLGGNCTCINNFESYCAESSDAFQGTSYLSAAVLICQFMIGLVLTWELATYGVYGGTHDTTRLCLLFSLVALATEALSLVAFYSTYSAQHCGDSSFKENGYSLGWAYYYRIAELVLMLIYVLITLRSFSASTRGPPSGLLLLIIFLMGLSGFSSQSHSWMISADKNVGYSTWEACTCESLCSSANTMMLVTFILLCVQAAMAFVGSFFSALRAVDNEGLTPKYTIVSSSLGLVLSIGTSAVFLVTVRNGSSPCDSPVAYTLEWGIQMQLAVTCGFLLAIILNAVYLKSTTITVVGADGVEEVRHSSQVGGEDGAEYTIRLYHTLWWFELKDPRTLSHERREGEDSDVDASDSDEEEGSPLTGGTSPTTDEKSRTRGSDGSNHEPFNRTKESKGSVSPVAASQPPPAAATDGDDGIEEISA